MENFAEKIRKKKAKEPGFLSLISERARGRKLAYRTEDEGRLAPGIKARGIGIGATTNKEHGKRIFSE